MNNTNIFTLNQIHERYISKKYIYIFTRILSHYIGILVPEPTEPPQSFAPTSMPNPSTLNKPDSQPVKVNLQMADNKESGKEQSQVSNIGGIMYTGNLIIY